MHRNNTSCFSFCESEIWNMHAFTFLSWIFFPVLKKRGASETRGSLFFRTFVHVIQIFTHLAMYQKRASPLQRPINNSGHRTLWIFRSNILAVRNESLLFVAEVTSGENFSRHAVQSFRAHLITHKWRVIWLYTHAAIYILERWVGGFSGGKWGDFLKAGERERELVCYGSLVSLCIKHGNRRFYNSRATVLLFSVLSASGGKMWRLNEMGAIFCCFRRKLRAVFCGEKGACLYNGLFLLSRDMDVILRMRFLTRQVVSVKFFFCMCFRIWHDRFRGEFSLFFATSILLPLF